MEDKLFFRYMCYPLKAKTIIIITGIIIKNMVTY